MSGAMELPGVLSHYQPTNQYALRQAANGIMKTFGHASGKLPSLDQDEVDVLNAAYQQLLRAANQLEKIKRVAEGKP